ncbi:MAG: sigma-70 family RNA polymerase sigma factor [Candidatus Omnitrophica bacterium]|nr:sigma-70 family RNA polymerase sigma factor [Candidatus Omnitrophota bacterium]
MERTALSDEELVTRARGGNRDAFGALVLRYERHAILIAEGILGNWELAKDASQNAFAKAYFALKKFREDSKFKTWFFRIVMNEAKDVYRKEKSRGRFKMWSSEETEEGEEKSILELIPSETESPRELFEARELKNQLERAISQLPDRLRQVFVLRYLNGLSIREISESLGIAIGTVKAHLAQGVHKLKEFLSPVVAEAQGKSNLRR